jgi:hypothetical protein
LSTETADPPRSPLLCRTPFLWGLVALGAALRIFQYASDTSLWFDELSIVRNLVHRGSAQLLREPLRYHQVAPVGFMIAEKGMSRLLGESDLAFRFLLLPVGLAALVLFLPLARRLLDGYAVPFAVATFAIGAPFIRYCAEIKQYGIDLAAVIALSLVTLRLRDPDSTAGRCVRAAIAGAVLVWVSQATVFVLAGLGAALLLAWLRDRDPQTRRALLVAVPVWAVACVAATVVALRLVTPETRAFMDRFWRVRGGFPPWPIRQPADLLWLWDRVTQLFGDDMVLRYQWPALNGAMVVVGMVVLWRRNRIGALVLLGPFTVAVFAAVAQQYPFRTRLVLYVLPCLVLAFAQGAEWLRRKAARLHPAIGGACMALLFAGGPAWSFVRVPPPYFVEDYKTVLAFAREHRQPGDAVFVTPLACEAVERYGPEYGLAPGDYQLGSCSAEDRRVLLREVDRYRGRPRLWVIASAVPPFQPQRASVEKYLSTIGVRKLSIAVPSEQPLFPVSAILFDLSDPARLAAASAETFPLEPEGPFRILCGEWVEPLR